ncbi:uncharacterized protein LOC130899836 [Diorhabda carinulata]|uniref:uncharacterized protein LOC130899836 n=1 Tax=Diorhabda carinulata TaxID=1163345 RepID=UPI0025A261B0|nr:uncharacterized protein LOC130899836 [Diorhabda carinulata]
MPVDKFGHRHQTSYARLPVKITFPHTQDGNIDIENMKICNVKEPTTNSDAATKKYVDVQLNDLRAINSPLIQAHVVVLQQQDRDIKDLAVGLNEMRNELHKTKIPILQAHITNLQNKTNEIDTFISRNPPVAARDMATKKYVDDSIVAAKIFIRKEFTASINMCVESIRELQKEITENIRSVSDMKTKVSGIVNNIKVMNTNTVNRINSLELKLAGSTS